MGTDDGNDDDDDDDDDDDLMPSKKLDEKHKFHTGEKDLKLEHSINLERVHAHFNSLRCAPP